MVCCCVSGVTLTKSDFDESTILFFYMVSYTAFMIIIIITLSPYFEWKLVSFCRKYVNFILLHFGIYYLFYRSVRYKMRCL